MADFQTGPKKPQITPNCTFCVPKSHKNSGVGEWVLRFGKVFPKKRVFLEISFFKVLQISVRSNMCYIFMQGAGGSRISNMTFPCVKCEIHKYANMYIHKNKVLKRPNCETIGCTVVAQ